MTLNRKHAAVFLAVLGTTLLIAGGMSVLAQSSDSPDYTQATQLTDGDNMTQFNGSDGTGSAYYLNRTWESSSPEIRAIDPETGEVHVTWTKSDLSETVNDSTNNTWAYRANFTESHLADIPMDSGENKNVTLQMVHDATKSAENETVTNWTVTAENVEGRTTYRIGPTVAANDEIVTLDTDGFTIETFNLSLMQDDYAQFEQENVPINGSGSDVIIHYANETSVNALEQSTTDYDSGEWVKRTLVEAETSDGESIRVPAYKNELPDDVDAQSDTYALIDTSDNTIRTHAGDEFEDDTEIEAVGVRANDDALAYLQFYQSKFFGLSLGLESLNFTFDFGGLMSLTGGTGALLGSAVLFGRPESPFDEAS
ncbi:hypothetical protein [Halostella litorea]|uniref:hypothetical protein n=1 Tax=Halostella litorea TaxID=2528831 RepID=UPI001091E9B0|nr:hypothetical protein [Halostella litorea]